MLEKHNLTTTENDEILHLNIKNIIPNKQQPRTIFNHEKITDLAESIKEHGVVQPIIVRPSMNGYEIIAGERRYRASQLLGNTTIPAIIRNYDDVQTASIAIIENIQREDLSSIEEAIAYKQLMQLHDIKQSELAIQIGKSQSTIANKIRLLNLTEEVQQAIIDKKITERHARTLLNIKNEKQQIKLLNTIIKKHLNVAQTEKLITDYLVPITKQKKGKTIIKIPRNFRLAMNTFTQAAMMVEKTGMTVTTLTEETEEAFVIKFELKK